MLPTLPTGRSDDRQERDARRRVDALLEVAGELVVDLVADHEAQLALHGAEERTVAHERGVVVEAP